MLEESVPSLHFPLLENFHNIRWSLISIQMWLEFDFIQMWLNFIYAHGNFKSEAIVSRRTSRVATNFLVKRTHPLLMNHNLLRRLVRKPVVMLNWAEKAQVICWWLDYAQWCLQASPIFHLNSIIHCENH